MTTKDNIAHNISIEPICGCITSQNIDLFHWISKKVFQQEIVCLHKEKSLVEFENLSTSTMLKDSKTLGKKALEGFGVPLGAKKDDLYE